VSERQAKVTTPLLPVSSRYETGDTWTGPTAPSRSSPRRKRLPSKFRVVTILDRGDLRRARLHPGGGEGRHRSSSPLLLSRLPGPFPSCRATSPAGARHRRGGHGVGQLEGPTGRAGLDGPPPPRRAIRHRGHRPQA